MMTLSWGNLEWLEGMARIALWMTPLLAGLLLLRPWLRRWIGGRGMALLWAVVIVRLLIPATWVIPQEWNAEVRSLVEQKEAVLDGKTLETGQKKHDVVESGGNAPTPVMIGWIWLAGTGVMLCWSLLGALRLCRLKRTPVCDPAILSAWEEIDVRLRGKVGLKTSADIPAPALVGRSIWLPAGWQLSQEQWRHILLHELGHHRRGDLWMQWLGLLTRAIYWWNPLVWFTVRAAAEDREVACDEWVRRNGAEVEEYGSTLITLSRKITGGTLPGTVLMATGRRQLISRIQAMSHGPVAAGWAGAISGVILASAVTVVTARAEKGIEKRPWEELWSSSFYRQQMKLENPELFRKILARGSLQAEARLYQLPEEESQGLLEKIALSAMTKANSGFGRVFLLNKEEAERIDTALYRELTIPPFLVPAGEQGNRGLERFIRYYVPGGKVEEPEVRQVGLRLSLEAPSPGQLELINIQMAITELIGFETEGSTIATYEPMPWRERLIERLVDFHQPTQTEKPMLQKRTARLTDWEAPQPGPAYLLLRLFSHDNGDTSTGPEMRKLHRRATAHEPLAHYPASTLEYWAVVKISFIPPEKPPSP